MDGMDRWMVWMDGMDGWYGWMVWMDGWMDGSMDRIVRYDKLHVRTIVKTIRSIILYTIIVECGFRSFGRSVLRLLYWYIRGSMSE